MFQIETRPSRGTFSPGIGGSTRHRRVCRSRHRRIDTSRQYADRGIDRSEPLFSSVSRPTITVISSTRSFVVNRKSALSSLRYGPLVGTIPNPRTGIAERRAEHPPFGKTRAGKVPHAESGPETNCLRLVSRTVSAILEQVRRLRSGNGQTIATFVLGNVGMSLDPNKTHAVTPIDA